MSGYGCGMPVHESHTIKISGPITVGDLERLCEKARRAGADDSTRCQVTARSGHQRDEIPESITVVIA